MPELAWQFQDHRLQRSDLPWLMGIVNVTPDSFSDGGCYDDPKRAVEHALALVAQGADVLDVGGESTRPGADPVPLDEELKRVVPVIDALSAQCDLPISIDTHKARVAEEALAAGASIVNDISGLTFDPRMIEVCAAADCGVVCMHIQGTPQTMQQAPKYDNVLSEVTAHLHARLDILERAGISRERILLDPGIGFGKTAEHNLAILRGVGTLRELGRPVLIGHSRKRFLKSLLGRDVDERLSGTIGVSIGLAARSVDALRVHDVGSVRDALVAWMSVVSETFTLATAGELR